MSVELEQQAESAGLSVEDLMSGVSGTVRGPSEETLPVAPPAFDPVEAAAQVFSTYMPQFKGLVRRLSNRQLKRLICALIEVPLQKKDYKHPTKEEQAGFIVGDRLLQAKWMMMLSAFNDYNRKQAEAAAVNAAPPGAVPLDEALTAAKNRDSLNTQGENS